MTQNRVQNILFTKTPNILQNKHTVFIAIYSQIALSESLRRKDAKNAAFIVHTVINNKTIGTKAHYVSSLRQWVTYCVSIDEDPFQIPINPELAAFWIADRTQQMGSIKSINTWQAMLSWICSMYNVTPTYKEDPLYRNFINSLYKQFHIPADTRLPYEIFHIYTFVKSKFCLLYTSDAADE